MFLLRAARKCLSSRRHFTAPPAARRSCRVGVVPRGTSLTAEGSHTDPRVLPSRCTPWEDQLRVSGACSGPDACVRVDKAVSPY